MEGAHNLEPWDFRSRGSHSVQIVTCARMFIAKWFVQNGETNFSSRRINNLGPINGIR